MIPEKPIVVGEEGWVLAQYNGEIASKWRGPVTKTMYAFSTAEPVQYLDVRDWKGLSMVLIAEGQPMFEGLT